MASTLDVDGLEMFTGFLPLRDARKLHEIRDRVAGKGMTVPMLCCSPDFTKPDRVERAAEVEKQKTAISAAAALGAMFCRVLSGQRRPEVSIGEGIGYAAECIKQCLPTAEALGVTLILENHYKDGFWDYPELAQKKDDFLALLGAIGNPPNFGVNYDPSNAVVAGDDPIELLEEVKHRVVTMHASDRFLAPGGSLDDLKELDAHPTKGYAPFLRHGVVGEGLNDYDRIFSILRDVGFQGWVSIEDGEDPDVGMEHLAKSAQFLRAKMGQYGLE